MPKTRDVSFRDLIEEFSRELASAIARQVEEKVASALERLGRGGKVDGRRGGRLCPVPGCGQPGAGPRNRWFCRDHAGKLSVVEQKRILERNRQLAAEGKLPTEVPATRILRLPPKEKRTRRPLDMSCRVEGCPNRSRGPRAGFICDTHRSQLSVEEQRAARERWNARRRGDVPVAAVAEVKPAAPTPVPPIVRKAEQAEG